MELTQVALRPNSQAGKAICVQYVVDSNFLLTLWWWVAYQWRQRFRYVRWRTESSSMMTYDEK